MGTIKQKIKRVLEAGIAGVTTSETPRMLKGLPRPYLYGLRMRKILGPGLAADTVWSPPEKSDAPGEIGSLEAIFGDVGSIHKWRHYLPIYESALAKFKGAPIRMLEIGVSRGGSLEMWRRFLPPNSVIVGLDIDPGAAGFDQPDRDIHVRVGDQCDVGFLRRVIDEFGPFDVILDDGGHTNSQMVDSFRCLFPEGLAGGGVYIVEDVHAAYWSFTRDSGMSFVDFTKWLIDAMHAHYQTIQTETAFRQDGKECLHTLTVPLATTILEKLEIHDSIVVAYRAQGQRDLPRSILHGTDFPYNPVRRDT